ncbi:MAG: hypothetical protein ACC726_16870 [Chloroflexota bacterium]
MSESAQVRRHSHATWLIPLGLFAIAAAVRLLAASQLPFPTTEPSAYFVNVAQNLVAGNGLVSDSVWSYATAPLVAPKPAFDLWLPMSSLVSALAMTVLGSSFWAAQVGGALLGALVAPLAWAVAREAGRTQQLDARRSGAVALTAGLLAAILAPLVLGSIVPDSYTPYLVFTLLAVVLVPRVLGIEIGNEATPPRHPTMFGGLTLGVIMGLAYLSRQEIIWLGLAFLLMLLWVVRARPQETRLADAVRRLWPVVAGGLLVVVPWLLRSARDFGSLFPGQAIENAFLRRNEDIFAFVERPSLATYLEQGFTTVLGNPLAAAVDALVNVLAVPTFPIGVVGLIALVGLRRTPALRRPTALVVLLLSGAMTFFSTVLLFPVATLWGTFLHASGPLLVALIVMAALGGDALLARISNLRHWEKPNVIVAPIALLAVAMLLTVLQVRIFAAQSRTTEDRYVALAGAVQAVAAEAGTDIPDTIITDHPMWVASILGRSAIALPDEDLGSIVALSQQFDAPWVIVVGERGRYPELLRQEPRNACLARDPIPLPVDAEPAWLFVLDERCETT